VFRGHDAIERRQTAATDFVAGISPRSESPHNPGYSSNVMQKIKTKTYQRVAAATAIWLPAAGWAQSTTNAPGHSPQGVASAAPAAAASAASAASAVSAKAQGSTVLKDVVVTARRRNELAQKVPAPVATVSGSDLDAQRNYRIQDLQNTLPSLNVAYIQPRESSISIRGIGNNPANDGLEPSVGVYLDDVYLGRPGMAAFDLFDIQQIELLRGPQGTLFGKNTTAGVLNIATQPPTDTLTAALEQSAGSRGYTQTKANVSGPVSDTVSASLSLAHTHDDGDITNLYDGATVNGGWRDGARGQLLIKPEHDLSVRVIADYEAEEGTQGTQVLYGIAPTADNYLTEASRIGVTPVINPSAYQVDLNSPQGVSLHQGGLSVEVNRTSPTGFTFTSITAGRFWNFLPANDGDYTAGSAIVDSGVAINDHQLSQEFRLASPTGNRFDYVVGAYFFHQQLNNTTFDYLGPQADAYAGTPEGTLDNLTSLAPGTISTNSAALFGQGTWHLTSRADLTFGIRGTDEEKSAAITRDAPTGGAVLSSPVLEAIRNSVLGPYSTGDLGVHSLSPSLLLNFGYKLSPEVLAYASLSHGEKSGGVNMAVAATPTLGPDALLVGAERANDAELGVKSEWLDHRLIFNGNLFWTQINGYQASSYVDGPTGLPVSIVSNAANVRSRGAEIDLRAKPLRHLTVGLNGSFVDATYSAYNDAPCVGGAVSTDCSLTGRPVSGAPRWIVNANARYDLPLGFDDVDEYFAAQYSVRSSQYGTLDDASYGKLPGYGIVNLATGWRLPNGAHQWDFSIWAHNLLNKRYYLASYTSTSGVYSASVGDTLTVGATLRYDY